MVDNLTPAQPMVPLPLLQGLGHFAGVLACFLWSFLLTTTEIYLNLGV